MRPDANRNAVRHRCARTLVAILLIFSVGGHWAVLQSVAWVTMVMDFSKEAPLSVAVQKTFDGKHPCKICKVVRHGQQTEQKQDATKSKVKSDFWLAEGKSEFQHAIAIERVLTPHHLLLAGRGQSPPVPPPRLS